MKKDTALRAHHKFETEEACTLMITPLQCTPAKSAACLSGLGRCLDPTQVPRNMQEH